MPPPAGLQTPGARLAVRPSGTQGWPLAACRVGLEYPAHRRRLSSVKSPGQKRGRP
jgi:hypothetical protein